MTTETKKIKRQMEGIIVSDKMDKTRVVKVTRQRWHSKYKKQYRTSQKYKAHDAKNEYHSGDQVLIEETRPISRDKRWQIIKKI